MLPQNCKPQVKMLGLDPHSQVTTVALVGIETTSGLALCDSPDLSQEWCKGIVGRQQNGRLYPSDGEKFLDELPFVYRSPYLWAEAIAEKIANAIV